MGYDLDDFLSLDAQFEYADEEYDEEYWDEDDLWDRDAAFIAEHYWQE